LDREAIEARVDELRTAHPGRAEFIEAVQEFSKTLDPDDRQVLGDVLLRRKSEAAGGFEVLERRAQEGGWIRRTMRKADFPDRRPPR
jgi:hypothetical protein